MANGQRTIALIEEHDAWLSEQIAAGRCADLSDAIGSIIRRAMEGGLDPEPDDFGAKLLASEGSIDKDTDLGFDPPAVGDKRALEVAKARGIKRLQLLQSSVQKRRTPVDNDF